MLIKIRFVTHDNANSEIPNFLWIESRVIQLNCIKIVYLDCYERPQKYHNISVQNSELNFIYIPIVLTHFFM